MLSNKYNEETKKFFQKLMLFVDATLVSAVDQTDNVEKNKILVSSLQNVKDALFAEIVRDNCISEINILIQQSESKKKSEKDPNSNQETE